MKSLFSLLACTWAMSAAVLAQTWNPISPTLFGDQAFQFLSSDLDVSSNGSRLVVGAPSASPEYVRVYENQSGTWVQVGSDVAGTYANSSHGFKVDVSGDGTTIALTAILSAENGTNSGHCRVLEWSGTDWVQVGQTIAGPAGSRLGSSVSLNEDGTVVAVSTNGDDTQGNNRGKVEVFGFNGMSWDPLGSPIYGDADGDFSGDEISLSGDGTRLAIGAPNNDDGDTNGGQVRVFFYNGTDWVQMGADIDGTGSGAHFGDRVELSSDGTTLIAGAPDANAPTDREGYARVYRNVAGLWVQLGPDIVGDLIDGELGSSVSISSNGNRVAVGIPDPNNQTGLPGRAQVYDFNGASWQLVDSTLSEDDNGGSFGSDVVLSADGNTLVVNDNISAELADFGGAIYGYTLGSAQPITPDVQPLLDVETTCSVFSLPAPTATLLDGSTLSATTDFPFPLTTLGTTTITWTYDDGLGNTLTQDQDVILSLSEAPVPDLASLPSVVQECSIETLTPPTATDDCDGVIEATTAFPLPYTTIGSAIVTWTFTDSQGNTDTQQQTITVQQYSGPLPLIVADAVSLPPLVENCQLSSATPPTATTACGQTLTGESQAPFPIADANEIIWVYTDSEGNTLQQSQPLTLLNTVPPVPDVASLPNVYQPCEVNYLQPPTATDDCSQIVQVSHDATLPITETTTVTWTFTDFQGNGASQTQAVIIDNALPTQEWTPLGNPIEDPTVLFAGNTQGLNAAGDFVVVASVNSNSYANQGGVVATYAWDGTSWNSAAPAVYTGVDFDYFGRSIDLNAAGDVLAVGGSANGGKVHVYSFSGGEWVLQQALTGQSALDDFGSAVSLNSAGDRLAVASAGNESATPIDNYVEVYAWDGISWNLLGTRMDEPAQSNFGSDLDFSDDGQRLAVGIDRFIPAGETAEKGAVRVYGFDGTDWQPLGVDLVGSKDSGQFGLSLDLSGNGNALAVGAPQFLDGLARAGSVQVFDWNGATWQLVGSEIVGTQSDAFAGADVCLNTDGTRLVFSEIYFDNAEVNAGRVRGFDRYNDTWVAHANELEGDVIVDNLGTSLEINADGSVLAAYSRHATSSIDNAGEVELFSLETVASPCAPAVGCEGDLNLDGEINTQDLLLLLGEFNCNSECMYDLSGDDIVGTPDVLVILGVFGTTCP